MKTPQQAAAAWAASSGRAATNWADGVQSYSGDWAGATTRQQAVMQQNLNDAISSGRWAAGVNKGGTPHWKAQTVASQSNFTNGFSKGAPRQAAAIQKIMQAEATINQSLPPRGTFEQNVARSVAVQTQLHALKGTLGA